MSKDWTTVERGEFKIVTEKLTNEAGEALYRAYCGKVSPWYSYSLKSASDAISTFLSDTFEYNDLTIDELMDGVEEE